VSDGESSAGNREADRENTEGASISLSRRRWDWRIPFISLQNRNFRIFTFGSLVSITALQMQQLAQNYLVYQLTGLATAIGYVSAAIGVSILVFSFAGGTFADRVGKRKLLAVTQLGIAVFALFIGLMISLDIIQVWHIVVSSVAIGILAAFNNPARQSYVPDLVGTENVMNAMALTSGIMNMTRIAGPALAGVLIGLFGVGPLYYTKFVAYCIFVAVLFFIPVTGKASAPASRSPVQDALDGLRYLRRDRRVLDILILAVVPVVFGMPYVNFLPVFQEAVFHVGPTELGIMMSVVGGGAVFGRLRPVSGSTGVSWRRQYRLHDPQQFPGNDNRPARDARSGYGHIYDELRTYAARLITYRCPLRCLRCPLDYRHLRRRNLRIRCPHGTVPPFTPANIKRRLLGYLLGSLLVKIVYLVSK